MNFNVEGEQYVCAGHVRLPSPASSQYDTPLTQPPFPAAQHSRTDLPPQPHHLTPTRRIPQPPNPSTPRRRHFRPRHANRSPRRHLRQPFRPNRPAARHSHHPAERHRRALPLAAITRRGAVVSEVPAGAGPRGGCAGREASGAVRAKCHGKAVCSRRGLFEGGVEVDGQ